MALYERVPKPLRPLTHGYAAWGIYLTAAVKVLHENWGLFGDMPWWATLLMLGGVLILRIVPQASVDEGDDDEPTS